MSRPKKRWEVWLNAYSLYGGDCLLGTYRWKWVAQLRAQHSLASFQGYVYSTTVKEAK